MTDVIRYPLSAVAEQCPTCRIWTDDAASCRHGRRGARYTPRILPAPAWLRTLAANLAIAGGLQLAHKTARFAWSPGQRLPHPRFR